MPMPKPSPKLHPTKRTSTSRSASRPRVRLVLALVLSLEGKYGEAETISRQDMSPEEARANVQSIQMMIAQSDTWRTLQTKGAKAKAPPKTAAAPADPQG